MADIKTARPTEYKEIVYRSKSEAMFARYLELRLDESIDLQSSPLTPWFRERSYRNGSGGFVYEPEFLEIDGWRPDFVVFEMLIPKFGAGVLGTGITRFPGLKIEVIEYKPSLPTETYILEFCGRYIKMLQRSGEDGSCCSASIYYGSVFNDECGIVSCGRDRFEHIAGEDGDWLINYRDAIKATRFDLVSGSNEVSEPTVTFSPIEIELLMLGIYYKLDHLDLEQAYKYLPDDSQVQAIIASVKHCGESGDKYAKRYDFAARHKFSRATPEARLEELMTRCAEVMGGR